MAPLKWTHRTLALLVVFLLTATATVRGHEPPEVDEVVFTGKVVCSLGYAPLHTADLCTRHDARHHDLIIHPHLTTVVVWLDAIAAPHEVPLRLSWMSPVGLDSTTGDEVLHIQAPEEWPSWHQTQTGRLTVRAAPDGLPNAAIAQEYRVCIGLFYDGADVPSDYHPCPEDVS